MADIKFSIASTVTDLRFAYEALRVIGDGDGDGNLADWYEDQLVVVRARDMNELCIKFDALMSLAEPNSDALSERGHAMLIARVASLRVDIHALKGGVQ